MASKPRYKLQCGVPSLADHLDLIDAVDDIDINPALPSLMTLKYGNSGIFLMMRNAGFISSTVGLKRSHAPPRTEVLDDYR